MRRIGITFAGDTDGGVNTGCGWIKRPSCCRWSISCCRRRLNRATRSRYGWSGAGLTGIKLLYLGNPPMGIGATEQEKLVPDSLPKNHSVEGTHPKNA